ncbi:MAG: tRNA 2-thiouridine(34) synthase MnmA [Lachnotalea sp.]
MEKEKVVIGMSGGVDSSVAAYLLKKQGYEVIGATMQIWQDEDAETKEDNGGCCGLSAVDDARRVANDLDIPYYVMNFKKEFKENVMDYFIEEYIQGRTPNPCIACNRYVKWESLLNRSLEIGADYIATGHYAQIAKLPNGRFALKKSATVAKDQTYALYNLTQYQLSHTIMPVGEYKKDEIRKIATEIGLKIANKPDSQEICFIPDNNYAKFIEENTEVKLTDGNFVDLDGNIIGKHKGITHYTIGQRKGLNLAMGHPVFVTQIRPDTNEVVIGEAEDVFANKLVANNINYMSIEDLVGKMQVIAKIRYSHKGDSCTIEKIDNEKVLCTFDEPQRAITPGQAVVFYDGEYVVGGGTIVSAVE